VRRAAREVHRDVEVAAPAVHQEPERAAALLRKEPIEFLQAPHLPVIQPEDHVPDPEPGALGDAAGPHNRKAVR